MSPLEPGGGSSRKPTRCKGYRAPAVCDDGMKPIPLAAILAGGKARRMGSDKVRLLLDGVPLIERVYSRVAPVAERVVVIGGDPHLAPAAAPYVPDRYLGADSMGGIATALWCAGNVAGSGGWVLCVACDMPLLEPGLLVYLWELRSSWDAVVPRVEAGYEPLCALYKTSCLPLLEECIGKGDLRIRSLFAKVRTREVKGEELRRVDPCLRSFLNVNRPDDLALALKFLRQAV